MRTLDKFSLLKPPPPSELAHHPEIIKAFNDGYFKGVSDGMLLVLAYRKNIMDKMDTVLLNRHIREEIKRIIFDG